jgi:hypothetical protein
MITTLITSYSIKKEFLTPTTGEAEMHDIPMSEVTPDFALSWQAVGMHIKDSAGGRPYSWLIAHWISPCLGHLSFRLGNQLLFLSVGAAVAEGKSPRLNVKSMQNLLKQLESVRKTLV